MSTEHYFQRHSRLILFTFTKKLRSLLARAHDFPPARLKFRSTRVRALLRKTMFYWVNLSKSLESEIRLRRKHFQFFIFRGVNDNSANQTHEDSENWKDPNMPKPKNKKNPYIYFCLERKQSEEKYRGKSLRELVELCNAEWTQMSKFCCRFN